MGIFENSLEITLELASSMFAFKNLTLRGSGGQRWDMAMDLISTGRVKTADLLTHRFPLDRITEALDVQMDAGSPIKVLVVP